VTHTFQAPGRGLSWVRALNQSHGYGTGTLAAVLRPKARPEMLLGLTAGHVVSEDEQALVGDPCSLSSSTGTAIAGRLLDWFPYFRDMDRAVVVDAGLIELQATALEPLVGALDWPLGWADPQPGEELRVLTRQHRIPARMVRTAQSVPMQAGLANLRYDILNAALFDVQDTLRPGDSGAAVWNLKDELVGVLSGSAPPDAGAGAVMTPIRQILGWADAEVVLRYQELIAESRGAPAPLKPTAPPAPLAAGADSSSVDGAAELTLARTIWGEAREGGHQGMSAVGHVVLNRVIGASWWGRDVASVCLRPSQFSCWNDGDPNRSQMLKVTTADADFNVACGLAASFMAKDAGDPERLRNDPTKGATHYFAKRLSRWPDWALGRQPVAEIGGHLFFKDVG